MKRDVESLKRERDHACQINNELNLRKRELESNANSYECSNNKSTLTISSLQRDNKEKNEEIVKLKSRIR